MTLSDEAGRHAAVPSNERSGGPNDVPSNATDDANAYAKIDGALVVGVMSGTSLDGISAAVARFSQRTGDGAPSPANPRARDHQSQVCHATVATVAPLAANLHTLNAELVGYAHRPYSARERQALENAMQGGTAQDYCRLNADLGEWLAEAALGAMDAAGVKAHEVAAVASHGHTIWHEPGHSTWQIGDASRIAERTSCAVVSDFRARDVAAGGQGAPLVPMADSMLFSHATSFRALQNLGGIGNVTIVPPGLSGSGHEVRAFDTGPGVVVIDAVVRRLRPSWSYDENGAFAASGTPIAQVVEATLQHPYFRMLPPKSTGRELFSPAMIDRFVADCVSLEADDADIVATAVSLTARSVADQYRRYIDEPLAEVLLSGGGSQNRTLVDAIVLELSRVMPQVKVRRFEDVYFDSEAKEAVAFALLGYLHLCGLAGNVPSATGAAGPRVLGVLTPGVNRAQTSTFQ